MREVSIDQGFATEKAKLRPEFSDLEIESRRTARAFRITT
jgi:hypothetical protein